MTARTPASADTGIIWSIGNRIAAFAPLMLSSEESREAGEGFVLFGFRDPLPDGRYQFTASEKTDDFFATTGTQRHWLWLWISLRQAPLLAALFARLFARLAQLLAPIHSPYLSLVGVIDQKRLRGRED